MTEQWWIVLGVAAVLVVVMVVIAVRLVVRMTRLRGQLRAAGAPRSGRLAFWLALAYLVLPVDLLPDPVLLDDIGVLLLAVRSLTKEARSAAGAVKAGPGRDDAGAPRRIGV